MAMQPSEYSVPVPSDRQAILCLHCGKPQEVGRKAMSVTCKFCSKSLKLEDVKITRYEARRVIETCGTVTIDKKGHSRILAMNALEDLDDVRKLRPLLTM